MKGSCLCGAVSVEAEETRNVEACHCGMCRRWGGGPLLAVPGGKDVRFGGEDQIGCFDSSEWAQRGFCKQCGTHLFYKLKPTGEYMLPAGLFQPGTDFDFHGQIFIDKKPAYYEFANQTEMLTEQEVFEKYGAV